VGVVVLAKPSIIKNFSPSWFASVMGTGIVAIVCHLYAGRFVLLESLAALAWGLNMFLFALIFIPWILRIVLYRRESLLDLKNPIIGQFFATMPIACLVMSADFLIVGVNYMNTDLAIELAKIFWVVGAVIAVLISIIIPLQGFISQEVKIESLNPAWFMPPVSLIVIPVAGAKLIPYWPIDWQLSMLVLNYISWGSGFFLFLILEVICLYRFICYPPLPGKLAPTFWINLGPIGAGTIALLTLGNASTDFLGAYVLSIFNIFALFLWGFGLWWLICALFLTVYYFSHKNLPFSLSWWAFTFPLGAYTGATYLISSFLKSTLVFNYGCFCLSLLLILWVLVLVKTIRGVITLEVFL